MTNREFFSLVSKSNLSDDIKSFAVEALAKLDARNTKRRNTPSKTAIANEPIKAGILEVLAGGSKIASDIATACGISTQKVTALCGQLADDNLVVVGETKIKGKGTVKLYSLVETDETDEVGNDDDTAL